jgi:alpha-beta hydrolase superfamily lysophospholipase
MSKMANDPAMGATCAADPLGGGGSVSLRWIRTFLTSAPAVEPEDFNMCPILLVQPAADVWTPLSLSQPFFDKLRCDKSLALLEGAGHFPLEDLALAQLDHAVRAFLTKLESQANAATGRYSSSA